MANRGDVRPFVRFIAECTERTLDLFLWATTEYEHEFPALETNKDSSRTIFVNDNEAQILSEEESAPSPDQLDSSNCLNLSD